MYPNDVRISNEGMEASSESSNPQTTPSEGKMEGSTQRLPEQNEEDFSHLFHFGTNKAGMNDSKKEERDTIVLEMSKNSQYFQHANKMADKNRSKTAELALKLSNITKEELAACTRRYEREVLDLESKRDLNRICCVIGQFN